LRRELEWIPLKALRKDRKRRYASAESLAADVRRYLNGKPLEAAPESRAYLVRKFVRRNRVQVLAALAVALALVAGFGTALWQARVAAQQRDAADARRAESERVVSYLRTPLETLTEAAWDSNSLRDAEDRSQAVAGAKDVETLSEAERSAIMMAGVAISQFEALKAARDAERERADQLKKVSDFQSQMLAQIDTTKAGIDLMADVRERFVAALEKAGVPEAERTTRVDSLRQELVRVNATDTAAAMIDRTILKPAIAAIDAQFKDDPTTDASLRQALAELYRTIGLYDVALPLQESALATRRRVLGEEHPDTLTSMIRISVLFDVMEKHAESARYARDALEKRRRVLGEDHPDTIYAINTLGNALSELGLTAEAEPYYREALEKSLRVLGKLHATTSNSYLNLATVQDDPSEAQSNFAEALEIRRQLLGPEHPDTVVVISWIGFRLRNQGKLAEAEPYYREAMEKFRSVLGEEHPWTLKSVHNMGDLLQAQGKLDQAEPYVREALEKSRRVLGEEHLDTLRSIFVMGALLRAQGKHQEAIELLAPAEPANRKTFTGGNARRLADFLTPLGRARVGLGYDAERFTLAESNLLEAHPIYVAAKDRGPTHKDTLACVQGLVDLYTAWDAAEPGKGYDAKAAEWKAKLTPPAQPQ
jgi:tetratricopeptide (TPR) repeat protein